MGNYKSKQRQSSMWGFGSSMHENLLKLNNELQQIQITHSIQVSYKELNQVNLNFKMMKFI